MASAAGTITAADVDVVVPARAFMAPTRQLTTTAVPVRPGPAPGLAAAAQAAVFTG